MGIPIPIGNRHLAELHADFVRDFHCGACGFESLAMVRAKGFGEASSLLWLREAGAKEEARAAAEETASKSADLLVTLASCPVCREHDEPARKRARGNVVVEALIAAPVFGAVVGGVFVMKGSSSAAPFAAAIGAVAGFIVTIVKGSNRSIPLDEIHVFTAEELKLLTERAAERTSP